MRQTKLLFIVGVLLSAVLFASCQANTYAKKRKDEKAMLSKYIKDHNLTISTDSLLCDTMPAPWPENFYFKTYRGAYVRITKRNLKNERPISGHTLIMRYYLYNLPDDTNPVFDNFDSREGDYFVYSHDGYAPCIGWNDCIPFMRHDGECEMIIESVIGLEDQMIEVYSQKVKVVSFTVSNN